MRRTAVVAAFASLLLVGPVVSARAAGLAGETLDGHIPFAFEVRGTLMPAGDYVVRGADDVQPNLLEIRSTDGHRAAFFFVEDAGTRSASAIQPRLVFDRFGQKRFLRSLRLGDGDRESLPTSTDEIALARRQASTHTPAHASSSSGR
jgi:hypothetical protein